MTDFASQPEVPAAELPVPALAPDAFLPLPEAVQQAPAAVAGPFAPLLIDGADIDLTHLHEFSFTFDTGKRQGVQCFVTFSTHCFSDKYDPDRHPAGTTRTLVVSSLSTTLAVV